MAAPLRIHVLHAGFLQVAPSVLNGGLGLTKAGRQLLTRERISLPVCAYLIEHPKGLVLVDGGLSRDFSPRGEYDAKAVDRLLPPYLAAFYRPWVPAGKTVAEQLTARGLRPQDLELALLTHLDPDHVAGLRELGGIKRILLPEDEYFWACRTVYKARQPWKLWEDLPYERVFYRGSPLGPNRWAIDVFGDESLIMVNTPGHTDGHASILVRNGGRFALLAGDAAFCEENWRGEWMPGFGFSEKWMARSLRWLRETAAEPGCAAVLCSHDPSSIERTIEI